MRNVDSPSYKILKFKNTHNVDGSRTVWFTIWSYLAEYGARPRWKILRDAVNDCKHCTKENYHADYRGQHATLFSAMHYANIIAYDTITKKWFAKPADEWRVDYNDAR